MGNQRQADCRGNVCARGKILLFQLVKAIIINSALIINSYARLAMQSSQQTRAKLSIREFHLISTQPYVCLCTVLSNACTLIERCFNVQSKSTSSLEIIGALWYGLEPIQVVWLIPTAISDPVFISLSGKCYWPQDGRLLLHFYL